MKQPDSWIEAKGRNTYLWQACCVAARQVIDVSLHCGAKFEYSYVDEVDGFAATIYKSVRNPERFVEPTWHNSAPIQEATS